MALAMRTVTQEHVLILSGLSPPPALALAQFSLSNTIIGPNKGVAPCRRQEQLELSGDCADFALYLPCQQHHGALNIPGSKSQTLKC